MPFVPYNPITAWEDIRDSVYDRILSDESVMWEQEFDSRQKAKNFYGAQWHWIKSHKLNSAVSLDGMKVFLFKKRDYAIDKMEEGK